MKLYYIEFNDDDKKDEFIIASNDRIKYSDVYYEFDRYDFWNDKELLKWLKQFPNNEEIILNLINKLVMDFLKQNN